MNNYINLILSFCIALIFLSISFKNINPYKITLKQHVLMLAVISLSYVIIYNLSEPLSTLPLYIIPLFFIYFKCRKPLESFIIGILISITIILIDNLVGSLLIYTLGESFVSSVIGYYLTCIIIGLALYLVSYFIGKKYSNYKEFLLENYKSKYLKLIYVALILTFALFYFNINWNNSSNPIVLTKINSILFIGYGTVMIAICFVSLFFIKKEANFKYKQMQLDNLKEYTENLENLYTDMRKFRHDYINIISTMAGFIQERDMDALEKHFNDHIYPLNKKINKNNYKLGLLKNLQLPEIKGLVSAKVIHAQELGLDIILDIVEPINKINMDIIDLSRILGIILDNAIEASLESDDKKVNIAFINKNSSVIIVLINTFKGDIPPLSKLFKEGFSTKGENRGLGLSNLKDIVGKYMNISLDTYIENNEFYQEITINND